MPKSLFFKIEPHDDSIVTMASDAIWTIANKDALLKVEVYISHSDKEHSHCWCRVLCLTESSAKECLDAMLGIASGKKVFIRRKPTINYNKALGKEVQWEGWHGFVRFTLTSEPGGQVAEDGPFSISYHV